MKENADNLFLEVILDLVVVVIFGAYPIYTLMGLFH